MNRLLVMGCAAFALGAATAARATETGAEAARCENYAKLVTDHKGFKDGAKSINDSTDPSDVYDVLEKCPSQAKLFHAFEVMFGFIDVQNQEDGPKGTEMGDPNATEAERDQALADLKADSWKTVHGYEQQIKDGKLDEASLKATVRYMVWQKTQYNSYEGAGLELLARMYPAEYPSVKELVKARDGNYDYWEQIGDDWLPKRPPQKK